MKDIAPELLETLQGSFRNKFINSDDIKNLQDLLFEGKATYKEANEYSILLGEILSQVFGENITSEILPDGRFYFNIAERTIRPMMEQDYNLVATYCEELQTLLNHEAGLSVKGLKAELKPDKIDGIIKRLSNEENFEDIQWVLNEPVKLFSQSIVDDSIKKNAEFHYNIGLKPKIVRREAGNCCDWCKEVVGTYEYPDNVPKNVYRRHRYCRCTVEYIPVEGKKQNLHTKKWIDLDLKEKLELRKNYNIDK